MYSYITPTFNTDFAGALSYINECRAIVYELRQYKVDLLDKDAAGCKLLSHIIFGKLPVSVKRELVHKVNCNYPAIGDLFDHYKDIVQTLIRTSNYKPSAKTDKKDSRESLKMHSRLQINLVKILRYQRNLPRQLLRTLTQLWKLSLFLR